MSQKSLSANEIRRLFLNYFHEQQHEVVSSSSLIPHNDPTLLFTNAGMVQFKDVFLGKEKRHNSRATSSQRCVRAGGKHNDLDRVGYTARHHTFFEMLGNFSFGDYFKREAIQFAWQFLTETLKLPADKLWVTVYKDDTDAAKIWLDELKISPARFSYLGDDSNFWSMGATGPCGPCSEIFYDHGDHIFGSPPGTPDEDGDRYVEIWNLVFMQYERAEDGTLTALPKPSVDTGMGLERIAAVMQGVANNYDTDLFQPLIKKIAELAQINDLTQTSLRVIADHIRSCAFLITDGVTPLNEGRGYVLRRIIRRAVRHGHALGLTQPFFYSLVTTLVDLMGDAFPELRKNAAKVAQVLQQEEEQFNLTLEQGLKIFAQETAALTNKIIPGPIAFKLYDTYGFPLDLTADIAREQNLTIDYDGFELAMTEQRARSRQASKFGAATSVIAIDTATDFVGYAHQLARETGAIIALLQDNKMVTNLKPGDSGAVVLDRTPFYAESGGQVGDQGLLRTASSVFRVTDTKKHGTAHIHLGILEQGELKVGARIFAEVDFAKRTATVLNHTATHLLHMTLRQILGDHVIQKGSLVQPERLRFDFSHGAPLTTEQLQQIEYNVNAEIRANHTATVETTSPQAAIAQGAMALFEEKYGEEVRVVRFGNSIELCGGTHAHSSGDIGLFKITGESGVAAGIRRLEAVTGQAALEWIEKNNLAASEKLRQTEERLRQLEKEMHALKTKLAGSLSQDLANQAIEINGLKILAAKVANMDTKMLRQTVDDLKNKLGSAVIALATSEQNKVTIIAGVTKDQLPLVKAGELVKMLAEQVGGKGGGRPDLAEAGGTQPENLDTALASVLNWVQEKINS
jgi:alanyl-tRNA synthetase